MTDATTVSIKITGHETPRVSVALSAKGDGMKFKQFMVFKDAKTECEKVNKMFVGNRVISPTDQ